MWQILLSYLPIGKFSQWFHENPWFFFSFYSLFYRLFNKTFLFFVDVRQMFFLLIFGNYLNLLIVIIVSPCFHTLFKFKKLFYKNIYTVFSCSSVKSTNDLDIHFLMAAFAYLRSSNISSMISISLSNTLQKMSIKMVIKKY